MYGQALSQQHAAAPCFQYSPLGGCGLCWQGDVASTLLYCSSTVDVLILSLVLQALQPTSSDRGLAESSHEL